MLRPRLGVLLFVLTLDTSREYPGSAPFKRDLEAQISVQHLGTIPDLAKLDALAK